MNDVVAGHIPIMVVGLAGSLGAGAQLAVATQLAPGSALPEWPQPLHVFRSPQLTIKLPGGGDESAGPLWLPIDAKFPVEDYQRLQEALDETANSITFQQLLEQSSEKEKMYYI